MTDLHIDDFYKDAARILVLLYNQFPRKIMLYVEDISGPDQPDEFGLHSTRHIACFQTMLWLGTSGYLHFEQTVGQDALDQVTLTERAFLLLTSSTEDQVGGPATLPPDGLFVNRLRKELESGTSFSRADVVQQLLRAARRFD